MNWLPRGTKSMISLLTTIIPHIRRLCCSSGHVGNVMIVNTLDALEETPCIPLCLAFVLSYQLWWVVKVFHKSICAITSRKQFEKCQTTNFRFCIWVVDWHEEGSFNVQCSSTKLVLLQYKSTQLTAPLHHEGKLCLACLVVYYFSSRCILATFIDLSASLTSFISKDF